MTRINGNIPPKLLVDQHLLAEYREIVRIPNQVKKDLNKTILAIDKAPKFPKLGNGHTIYFYNKIEFLHKRFLELKLELSIRGFENNMDDEMFQNIPDFLYNDVIIEKDFNLEVKERILERISTMKSIPKYYKKPITIQEYENILII